MTGPHDFTGSPCGANPALWESTDIFDHINARNYCRQCPHQAPCRDLHRQTLETCDAGGRPSGTWAGRLYGPSGQPIHVPEPKPPTAAPLAATWTRLGAMLNIVLETGRGTADQRHIVMWVMRQHGLSYNEIARWCRRHHSTVIYGVRRVEQDAYLRRTAERVLAGVA